MSETNKDLLLTNSMLSFLRAGYYGQITFQSVLAQLNSTFAKDESLQSANKAMDKIDSWLEDLSKNLPIFSHSWTKPETFEGIKAFEFLSDLKTDLSQTIKAIEIALANKDLEHNKEATNLLIAGIARTASVRVVFLDSVALFFSRVGLKEQADLAKSQMAEANEYLQVSKIIFETFNTKKEIEPELFEKLLKEAELTPCDFRAHLHDILILLNCYSGDFTFEMAEFIPAEAQIWKDAQIAAIPAGYWRAYHFSPAEVVEWFQAGAQHPSLAANWKRAGFAPTAAKEWLAAGIPPSFALVWRKAGFDPEFCRKMLTRGIFDPEHARKLDESGDKESENQDSQGSQDSWEPQRQSG